MIRFHSLNLINKDYSEAWLNNMSDAGYSLEKVIWYMFYVFRKRNEEEEKDVYQLQVFAKDSMFSSMTSKQVEAFDERAKDCGLERLTSVAQVGIYKVIDKDKVQPLYSVQRERKIVQKVVKPLMTVLLFPLILMTIFGLISFVDNFAENDWDFNHIISNIMMFSMAIMLFMQYLKAKKFSKINEVIIGDPTRRPIYLNSALSHRIEVVSALFVIVLAIVSLTTSMIRMAHSSHVFAGLSAMLLSLLIPLSWALYFVKKVKPSVNLSEAQKKKRFFIGLVSITIFNLVVVMSIIMYSLER